MDNVTALVPGTKSTCSITLNDLLMRRNVAVVSLVETGFLSCLQAGTTVKYKLDYQRRVPYIYTEV